MKYKELGRQVEALKTRLTPSYEAVWAYERLKPALRLALEQIPSLYYFEGD